MPVSGLHPVPQGLPGSSAHPSVRATPNHPGQPDGCFCSFLPRRSQASPFFGRVATVTGVTRPNRVHLRCGPAHLPHPCGLDQAASAGRVTPAAGLVATCRTSNSQADLLAGRWMNQASPGAHEDHETARSTRKGRAAKGYAPSKRMVRPVGVTGTLSRAERPGCREAPHAVRAPGGVARE